jgi:hypothetical protein
MWDDAIALFATHEEGETLMKLLPLSGSLEIYADELTFTDAALSANPLTVDLAGAVRTKIESWDPMFKASRDSTREITRSNAVVAVRNAQIDETTRLMGGALLVDANQDRKSTLFRRIFPVAPSELIRWGFLEQLNQTRNVILPELTKLPATAKARAFLEPLTALATAGTEALQRRLEVWGAKSSVRLDVEEWKRGANALRTTVYAELLKLGAANGYTRAWADSFFRTGSSEETTTETTPAVTPAPATP